MQLTHTILVLTAALTSVSAHPSLNHQRYHNGRRAAGQFYKSTRPSGISVDEQIKAAAEPPPSSSPPAAEPPVPPTTSKASVANANPGPKPFSPKESAPSSKPAGPSSASAGGTGVLQSFCPGKTKTKRATHEQNTYIGNTGLCGWGSNMMQISPSDTTLYDYSLTFTASDNDFTCHCFNKIGPDGGLNGSFQNSAITFTLKKGDSTAIACEANTQAICACGFGSSVPVCSPIGQWTGTWAEFDMGSSPNGGQSGADVSVLPVQDCAANTGKVTSFPGMRIAANGNTCSWVKKDGSAEFQAYINGNHAADGVGCTGYTKNNLDIVLGDGFST